MSLPKGRRKRKDNQENAGFENETVIASDTNGFSNVSKKLKISEEALVTENFSLSRECFSCKVKDEETMKCSLDSCDKFYHRKCLDNLPSSKMEVNLCPLHICLTCFNINPKNPQIFKGDMLKCAKCPLAFHNKEACLVPGAVISTNSMLCPKHFTPEINRNYSGIKRLAFCVQCGCNKDLLFCNSCPAAIHKHCCKMKAMCSDDFECGRCLSRKTISFNDIVWAKVYDFRWWPSVVVNPKDVPETVNEMKHFDGEFPVKFFGSEEYYWIQMGRVYPFFYRKLSIEEEHANHDFERVISDPYFDDAVQLALAAVENRRFQSVEPTDHKKPPPYKHIKSNRPIGKVQLNTGHDVSDYNTCGCHPEDPNPCGYDSICLNRSMCTECHEDTCEAGTRCQNQKFQKLEYAPAKPFWTETRGWGLKCLKDIKKGTFVSEYCGDLIDEEECERRIQQKQLIGDTNFYFCTLDATRIIDAGPKGNSSRFMNHSCEPNCETQKWVVLGDARVGIFARKDIPAGSELTFDYQMDFSHFEKLKCNCGSKKCGGLIGKKPHNGVLHSSFEEEDEERPPVFNSKEKGDKSVKLQNGNLKKPNNVKDKKKDDSVKAEKQNRGKKNDDVKIKKQNGVKTDDNVKIKKRNRVKDNFKIKKQNGVKDDDVKVKKQNEMKKDDNLKIKKDKLLCFKCKTGGKMINCSHKDCSKSFHVRCLRPGWGPKDKAFKKWECPCHFCKKCKEGSTYQCYMCPNSFCGMHVKDKSNSSRFACPKHCDSD